MIFNRAAYLLFLSILMAFCHASPAMACAACYGRSDSPLASGMNWGILTLMACIVTVLVSIGGFFIYIIRRETSPAANETNSPDLSEAQI